MATNREKLLELELKNARTALRYAKDWFKLNGYESELLKIMKLEDGGQ